MSEIITSFFMLLTFYNPDIDDYKTKVFLKYEFHEQITCENMVQDLMYTQTANGYEVVHGYCIDISYLSDI